MAGGLALFWARALRAGAGALAAGRRAASWSWPRSGRWRSSPARYVLTGFPWALSAYAWVETPVIQAAALVGPHGLGFLTLVAGLLPGLATWRARRPRRRRWSAAGWGFGALRLAQPAPERAEPLLVRLVQPNAAQDAEVACRAWSGVLRAPSRASRAPGRPRPT